MTRRKHRWTAKEINLLRMHYGRESPEPWATKRLAAIIGVEPWKVSSAARHYGLKVTKRPRIGKDLEGEVILLHSQGKNDKEIAGIINCGKTTVLRFRWKLNLPPVVTKPWFHSEEKKQQMKRKQHNYWHVRGYSSSGHYVHERKRIAAEMRYRGCRTELECEIMELLDSSLTPLTRYEIISKLKHGSLHRVRILLNALLKRGLLKKAGFAPVKGIPGRGSPSILWVSAGKRSWEEVTERGRGR